MEENIKNFIKIGSTAIIEASKIINKAIHETGFSKKADDSPVTKVDQQAEMKIIDVIQTAFPTHKLIGEEFGTQNAETNSEYTWTFDPIDGTWSFINKEITFCVNLALVKNDTPILGIIYNPNTQELFISQGKEATLNTNPLPITNWRQLSDAVLNIQLHKNDQLNIQKLMNIWSQDKIGKFIMQGGSVAYNLALIAKGAHSVFILSGKPGGSDMWDLLAGTFLVRSVGGKVTDLEGNDISPFQHQGYLIASCNTSIHQQLLALLNEIQFGDQKS